MLYRMNDGVAYIYDVLGDKSAGLKPLRPFEGRGMADFEYISIGAGDYRFAMQDDVKIETRIRVLQNRKIVTKNVVRINDVFYKVWRVRHSVNKHNVPITDITLETTSDKYEVKV